eukprot:gene9347-19394_t
MRDLLLDHISGAVKCRLSDAVCFVLQKTGIGNFGTNILPSVCFVDLSVNDLQSMEGFFTNFPIAWWIDLSNNQITSLESIGIPLCIGSLNLSHNNLRYDDLIPLRHCHILRLNIKGNMYIDFEKESTQEYILECIPNLWILNEDYIPMKSRKRHSASSRHHSRGASRNHSISDTHKTASNNHISTSPQLKINTKIEINDEISSKYSNIASYLDEATAPSEWLSDHLYHIRQTNLLNAIQNISKSIESLNYSRLDIILEDYLHEVWIFNKHRLTQGLGGQPMPYVDCVHMLKLPHKIRVDLCVLLTATIIFDLPPMILRDGFVLLLHQYMPMTSIQDLVLLPRFIKTALVAMIHRICGREQMELKIAMRMSDKPLHTSVIDAMGIPPSPTFGHSSGFTFLKPFRMYLEQPLPNPGAGVVNTVDCAYLNNTYSELEEELLNAVPIAPSRFNMSETALEQSSYKDWMSLVSRHAVLLLTKCPSCPSLTRQQTSKAGQDTYRKMLPILRAAGMRYQDLELRFTGPEIDGRANQ